LSFLGASPPKVKADLGGAGASDAGAAVVAVAEKENPEDLVSVVGFGVNPPPELGVDSVDLDPKAPKPAKVVGGAGIATAGLAGAGAAAVTSAFPLLPSCSFCTPSRMSLYCCSSSATSMNGSSSTAF
jgi:hypothetical protein